MVPSLILYAIFGLTVSPFTASLEVAPGSTCASLCLDTANSNPNDPPSSQTLTGDLVCTEDQYSSTSQGQKFISCVDCLIKSPYVDNTTGQSDLYWALYNLKFAFDYCVLDQPTNPNLVNQNACSVSCTPFQPALTSGIPSDNTSTPIYAYCQIGGGEFLKSVDTCAYCLTQTPNTIYPTNFILTLKAACLQTPQPGHVVNFEGEIFSDNQITLGAPGSPSISPKPSTSHGLSTGAKAGIAVGAVIAVAAILAVLYIACVRRRHRLPAASRPDPAKPSRKTISGPIQEWISNRTSGASSHTAMENGIVLSDHKEGYSPQVHTPKADPEQLSPHVLYHRPGLLYNSSNPNSPKYGPNSPKYGTEGGSNAATRSLPSSPMPNSPGQPSSSLPVSPRPAYRQ